MAARTLSTYTEHAGGMTFTLNVERSAAGQPGLIFAVEARNADGTAFVDTCVLVDDGNEFLAPVLEWLNA